MPGKLPIAALSQSLAIFWHKVCWTGCELRLRPGSNPSLFDSPAMRDTINQPGPALLQSAMWWPMEVLSEWTLCLLTTGPWWMITSDRWSVADLPASLLATAGSSNSPASRVTLTPFSYQSANWKNYIKKIKSWKHKNNLRILKLIWPRFSFWIYIQIYVVNRSKIVLFASEFWADLSKACQSSQLASLPRPRQSNI